MTEEEVQSIIKNEAFVGLMMAAQDNQELKNNILYALRSDDMTRVDIIQTWVKSSTTKGAPKKFNEALSYLAHREIANEAIKLLAS
jgi:hypothetical protein